MKMNKRGVIPLIVIVLLVLAGAYVLLSSDKINIGGNIGGLTTRYTDVYKANYGNLCCLAGPLETLSPKKYAINVQTTSCSENVDACTLYFECLPLSGLIGWCAVKYDECNLDGSNCITRSYSVGKNDAKQFVLPVGKKATFLKNSFLSDDRKFYTFERKAQVYDLIGEENGKVFVSNGCSLSDSLKGQVLSGIPNNVPKGNKYCISYLTDFVSVATKTYKYNNQEVICQARSVYGIDIETFLDDSQRRIQSNKIADVECCPTESNCGTDFKFASSVKRECSYSTECDNGGDLYPLTQTTAGYFVCESGTCVKKTKSVECTSNAVCQTRHGEGYVCSMAEATWGICIEAPQGTYCGDGYCDIGESKATCPADCELECMDKEKLVTKEKRVDCFIGFPLYIGCSKEVSKECKPITPNYLLWILIIVGGLIVYFIILRPIFKGTPIGRYLP